MTSERMVWLPWAVAALLGLGIPRAFLLLYGVLLGVIWCSGRRGGPHPSPWVQWSTLWLVLFGIAYASAQLRWGVWTPLHAHLPQIVAVVILPSAALQAGWRLPRFGSSRLTGLILAYALGALIYALLSLALSRTPWWDLAETFQLNVRVPWGSEPVMNMRSVEQRAFPALACLPVALPLLFRPGAHRRWMGLALLVMSGLAAHVAWAYQGRIGLVVIGLAALPVFVYGCRRFGWLVCGVGAAVAALLVSVRPGGVQICDERWWLQRGFIQHLLDAPWGGRLIQFSYHDCQPDVWLRFGSVDGASTFSPHNVVLDIWNDAGWPATVCVLLAMAPLLLGLLWRFWRSFTQTPWQWPLALRWSMVSVLITEWCLQPFFYSDQLMFSLGFVLMGVLLAEFTMHSPEDCPAAKPSRLGTFD